MKHLFHWKCVVAKHWSDFLPVFASLVLFCIPFLWLAPGFVDFGGDAGKLYFWDPLASAIFYFRNQSPVWALSYSILGYDIFIYMLKQLLLSPTYMIAFEHGVQLSLGFLFMTLIVRELLKAAHKEKKSFLCSWTGFVAGFVYVGLVTKVGWQSSMQTQNQIFLNPMIWYLLLRFMTAPDAIYGILILLTTLLFSGNFGFTGMPQVASFYPITVMFLLSLLRWIYHTPIRWKQLIVLGVLSLGLHAFHIVPSVASLTEKSGTTFGMYFTKDAIGNRGVNYFDVNHENLGKISLELFQPSAWKGQTIVVVLIPAIILLGFLKKPSKLTALLGIFFVITFFLVSANITGVGVQFYRLLFSLPGFSMFRSFQEKWHFVYAFFYTLLFAVSFYHLIRNKRPVIAILVGFLVMGSVGYRIWPFLEGKGIQSTLYQSNNVSSVFKPDPDLLESIDYVKKLPYDGNVLTLPLTFPTYQIAYGIEGGAYEGISMVQFVGGKKDYPGFWTFGPYKEAVFEALRTDNVHELLQALSFLNIRYIFRNQDNRIMENFPGFPYVYPGELYYDKKILPSIKNQAAYDVLFSRFPLENKFNKGFYRIEEISSTIVRPTVYIPDNIFASQSAALSGSSYRSAYLDETTYQMLNSKDVRCDGIPTDPVPGVAFEKLSETDYNIKVDYADRTKPFLLVLSQDYHRSWTITIPGYKETIPHAIVNGYANGWIIDPKNVGGRTVQIRARLGFQVFYIYGWILSGCTAISIFGYGLYKLKTKYGKT